MKRRKRGGRSSAFAGRGGHRRGRWRRGIWRLGRFLPFWRFELLADEYEAAEKGGLYTIGGQLRRAGKDSSTKCSRDAWSSFWLAG